MKTLKQKALKEIYEFACNEYIRKFSNKQDLEFDGWVSDDVGGIACFSGQYSFNMSDIILDIQTKQHKGVILDWQNDGIDFNMKMGKTEFINYKSYTMGLRYKDLENGK